MTNLNNTKLALLAKKMCDKVYYNEYEGLPSIEFTRQPMIYGKDTLFTYYIDIYENRNIQELHTYDELTYLKTCCGQTITKRTISNRENEMFYYGKKLLDRVKERLDPPIRHPVLDRMLNNKQYSEFEFFTRKALWEEETLPVLENAPRTYLDMVVSRPGLNERILFKIIDGYKCNILFEQIEIDGRKKSNRTSISGFESVNYKELLEYYDVENILILPYELYKDSLNDEDDTYNKYFSLGHSIWYHKSLVETFNEELENIQYKSRVGWVDFGSLKYCLNVKNTNIVDIESGKLVSEQLSAELEEKVQFALIASWLLISHVIKPTHVNIPFKSR
jgi:hypothetical protein